MSVEIIQGDWIVELRSLPGNYFHSAITSPPYFCQRSYLTEEHPLKPLEVGREASPSEYISGLVSGFGELRRTLRNEATLWVVIDDKIIKGQPAGIPWRFVFAMQDSGWIFITEIIWNKTNPTPQSVRRKPTHSHEYVFLFAKSWDYYYDQNSIRTPYAASTVPRQMRAVSDSHKHINGAPGQAPHSMSKPRLNVRDVYNGEATKDYAPNGAQNPSDTKRRILESLMKHGGANKKSVWTIPKGSFPGSHFATFPPKLIEPMVLASTSERGCCAECGSPLSRVVIRTGHTNRREPAHVPGSSASKTDSTGWAPLTVATSDWERNCKCESELTVPCRVLDPFGGSGTVGEVCNSLNRNCTLIELNPEYLPLIQARAASRQVKKLDQGEGK